MDTLLRDVRIALRGLVRTPGFTVAAILALALGIGATTAIFSVVHAVLLSSLGWGEESRLVSIRGNFPGQGLLEIPVSAAEYFDLRRASFLTTTGLYGNRTAAIQGDRAERVKAGFATGTFFAAIGVQPTLGRVFNEEEDKQGGGDSVILSASAWRKRFAPRSPRCSSRKTCGCANGARKEPRILSPRSWSRRSSGLTSRMRN